LVKKGYIFADKTDFVRDLVNFGSISPSVLFSFPRGSGKSILLTMAKEFLSEEENPENAFETVLDNGYYRHFLVISFIYIPLFQEAIQYNVRRRVQRGALQKAPDNLYLPYSRCRRCKRS
jgi:predicted AAA+ superfamily ATPase